jgi:hypothetical protein
MKRVALMVVCGLALADAAIGHELFGMHLQNNRAFEQEFVAMERLGVTWVRREIPWSHVEPREGHFDWSFWDQLIESASRHHLKLLITVRALSPWGSSQLPPNFNDRGGYKTVYPPKDLRQYATFITALVGHYRGRGVSWQIENEVDAKAFWGGTRDDYLALLKTAYDAAHRADSAAVVLPAGLTSLWPHADAIEMRLERHHEWFDAILDTHAYDALDLHNYSLPESDPAWHTWGISFEQYIDAYQGWMRAKHVNVPLWITEAGINSAPIAIGSGRYTFTPEQQARDLESIYRSANARGIAHVFWLKLYDTQEPPYTTIGVSADREPKPSASVYRRLATGQ